MTAAAAAHTSPRQSSSSLGESMPPEPSPVPALSPATQKAVSASRAALASSISATEALAAVDTLMDELAKQARIVQAARVALRVARARLVAGETDLNRSAALWIERSGVTKGGA